MIANGISATITSALPKFQLLFNESPNLNSMFLLFISCKIAFILAISKINLLLFCQYYLFFSIFSFFNFNINFFYILFLSFILFIFFIIIFYFTLYFLYFL